VRGNTISDVGGSGIRNDGVFGPFVPGINTNAAIEGNTIHDVGFGVGGPAIGADGLQDSVVRNNLVYDAHGTGLSFAMVNASGGSKNDLVVNNTVVMAADAAGAAFRVAKGPNTGLTVLNNIFLTENTNRKADGGYSYAVDTTTGSTFDFNVVTNPVARHVSLKRWQQQGFDTHSIAVPAGTLAGVFVDPAADDYHLAPGSPAIDAGTATQAPATDLDGNPRPQGMDSTSVPTNSPRRSSPRRRSARRVAARTGGVDGAPHRPRSIRSTRSRVMVRAGREDGRGPSCSHITLT
jgi:hypothetical protein